MRAAGWSLRDQQIAQDLRGVSRDADRRQRARFRRPAAQDGRAVRDERARARRSTRSKFRYILVDEYQDTNRPQYLLIQRLAEHPPQPVRRRRSRSVDLQVARRRPAQHPRLRAATSRDAHIVKLEQNYRSTQVILDAASAVISRNRNRKDKRLWTDRQGGDRILYIRAGDEIEEADFITRADPRGARRPDRTRWSRCSTAPTRSRARLKTR